MLVTMFGEAELRDAFPAGVEGSEACPVGDDGKERSVGCTDDRMPCSQELRDADCGGEDAERTSEDDARGYMNLRHKCNRNRIEGRTRPKRETARNMCRPLKQWLYSHRGLPYPNKSEKLDLAAKSKMTITQVSNWFANARRRLKKTVSSQPGLTWERRIKLYNRNVVGNQERLSISSADSSDDEQWQGEEDDDDEEEEEEQRSTFGYGDDDDFISSEGGISPPLSSSSSSPPTKPGSSTSSGNFSRSSSSSSSSGGGCGDVVGEKDGPDTPPPSDQCPGKFKQGIMQRYLSDAYRVNLMEGDLVDVVRLRNASGSLSSQDYEELSTTGSSRSTPVKEQHAEDNLEKSDVFRAGYDLCLEESEENDLLRKELSAVLVLMQFAASRRKVSPRVIFR